MIACYIGRVPEDLVGRLWEGGGGPVRVIAGAGEEWGLVFDNAGHHLRRALGGGLGLEPPHCATRPSAASKGRPHRPHAQGNTDTGVSYGSGGSNDSPPLPCRSAGAHPLNNDMIPNQ